MVRFKLKPSIGTKAQELGGRHVFLLRNDRRELPAKKALKIASYLCPLLPEAAMPMSLRSSSMVNELKVHRAHAPDANDAIDDAGDDRIVGAREQDAFAFEVRMQHLEDLGLILLGFSCLRSLAIATEDGALADRRIPLDVLGRLVLISRGCSSR